MTSRDIIGLAFGIGYRAGGGDGLKAIGWALGVRALVGLLRIPTDAPELPDSEAQRVRQLGTLSYQFAKFRNQSSQGAS